MALSDAEGIVVAANPGYYRLYGYRPEECIGQSYAVLFRRKTRGAMRKATRIPLPGRNAATL